MKKNNLLFNFLKLDKFLYLGLFFLFLQFVVILGSFRTDTFDIFFWFCNHTPLFFAIAFFIRNMNLIKAFINVGFLIQFLWFLDFLFALLFDFYIIGMTNYVFEDLVGFTILIPILLHIFSTNVALIFTFKEKTNYVVLFYSFFYLSFLFFLTFLFTSPENNINCIYEICEFESLTFPFYTYLWVPVMFFLIILPTFYFQKLLYYIYYLKKREYK